MTDKLTRNRHDVAKGSIKDIAAAEGKEEAEVLAEADAVILIDISSSMLDRMSDGSSKHEHAKKNVLQLQRDFVGKLAIVQFNNFPKLCLDGIIDGASGGTSLTPALEFIEPLDAMPDVRFIIVSDGQPQDGTRALAAANRFKSEIDVIWIGEDNDLQGREFMEKLASGEFHDKSSSPQMLGKAIAGLLGEPKTTVREST